MGEGKVSVEKRRQEAKFFSLIHFPFILFEFIAKFMPNGKIEICEGNYSIIKIIRVLN